MSGRPSARSRPVRRAVARGAVLQPAHLKDLHPDPANRRKHNPRNIGMLSDALQEVGAARSIVIDEDDAILAGNATVEAAGEVGITRVHVVEADGETVVAVRRRGLSPEQKRKLAMYDNRTAELAAWDSEQLQSDRAAGLDLKPFFSDQELEKLGPDEGAELAVEEVPTGKVADVFWVSIQGPLEHQAMALQRLQDAMKDLPGVQVELGTVPREAW